MGGHSRKGNYERFVYLLIVSKLTDFVCAACWGSLMDSEPPIFGIIKGLQTQYKEFPYAAALGWDSAMNPGAYDYKCGGVLIAKGFVLTAAHCAVLNG